jgi:hypothetical protein
VRSPIGPLSLFFSNTWPTPYSSLFYTASCSATTQSHGATPADSPACLAQPAPFVILTATQETESSQAVSKRNSPHLDIFYDFLDLISHEDRIDRTPGALQFDAKFPINRGPTTLNFLPQQKKLTKPKPELQHHRCATSMSPRPRWTHPKNQGGTPDLFMQATPPKELGRSRSVPSSSGKKKLSSGPQLGVNPWWVSALVRTPSGPLRDELPTSQTMKHWPC